MRIEEDQFRRVQWIGKLDESTHYRIEPFTGNDFLLHFMNPTVASSVRVGSDVPRLLNFYRDLGDLLDHLQPGLINPVPDGDPSVVDAMKMIYEADQIRGER